MNKRLTSIVVVVALSALSALSAGTVQAKSATLRVTGSVRGVSNSTSAVLLLAYDGTGVRAQLKSNGSFAISVPAKFVSKFVTRIRGRGATLHVLTEGIYMGPVLMRTASATKGYTRLSPSLKGTVALGAMTWKPGYASAAVPVKYLDVSSSIKLRKRAPISKFSGTRYGLPAVAQRVTAVGADSIQPGADADKDGLPNLADSDMNGDNIPDAAQPSSANDFQGLDKSQVLEARPVAKTALEKILSREADIEVNSNVNPSATASQIADFLKTSLTVDIYQAVDASTASGMKLVLDCTKLSYCEPGSTAVVRAPPRDPNDGKFLHQLQDADGKIVVPYVSYQGRFDVRFYPGAASTAQGNLTGDTYQVITSLNGQLSSSESLVVTSSVATPTAIVSLGGKSGSDPRGWTALRIPSLTALDIAFYRPQSFAPDSTEAQIRLLDRGGLSYVVTLWPEDDTNTGYRCMVSHFSNLSPTLIKGSSSQPDVLFDKEQVPAANGTKLSLTVDAQKCLADQNNRKHSFVSGDKWHVELEARDSDNNRVRVHQSFIVP